MMEPPNTTPANHATESCSGLGAELGGKQKEEK